MRKRNESTSNSIQEEIHFHNEYSKYTDTALVLTKLVVSDFSHAIVAAQKAAGFKKDHSRLILAILGASAGRTEEFEYCLGALGSRLKNNLQGFVSDEQLDKQNKSNSQRARRALEKLETDQEKSKIVFVVCKRGGCRPYGELQPSRITVDIKTFVEIVSKARARADFQNKRCFAFEEAAKEVLTTKHQQTITRLPPKQLTDREKLQRTQKTMSNSFKRMIGSAVESDFNGIALEELKEFVLEEFQENFKQALAEHQNETPFENFKVDTLLESELSQVTPHNRPAVSPLENRNTGGHIEHALGALKTFETVGANSFEVTLRDESSGQHTLHAVYNSAEIHEHLNRLLDRNEISNESLIIRPRGARFIQVDDCSLEVIDKLQLNSFLVIETSKDNYQAWLALPSDIDEASFKRTRARLLKQLEPTGANGGAYGAVRFPGSINRKPGRNNFRVHAVSVNLSRSTSVEELEKNGLLAPINKSSSPSKISTQKTTNKRLTRKFPDYAKCLSDKKGDRSRADASFLKISQMRGFSINEAKDELRRVSERVQDEERHGSNGYLDRTIDFVNSNHI